MNKILSHGQCLLAFIGDTEKTGMRATAPLAGEVQVVTSLTVLWVTTQGQYKTIDIFSQPQVLAQSSTALHYTNIQGQVAKFRLFQFNYIKGARD